MNPTGVLALAVIFIISQAPGAFSQITTGKSPVPPQTLTIDQAVQIALERNTGIALAQSQTETNAARVEGAFGAFLPQIVLNGGYTRQIYSSTTPQVGSGGFVQSDNTYNASAIASYPLFDGFSRSATYKGAQETYNSSVETLKRTRQDIAAQARAVYLNALRSEQIIEVRKNDLESLQEQLKRQQGLVDGGVAIITSVYAIEADIANAELAIEQARTDATVARHGLNLLLNYDPVLQIRLSSEGLASSIDSSAVSENRSRLGSLETMLATLNERADLRAARMRVDAFDAAIAAAKATYWPAVGSSLTYSWLKNDITSSNGLELGLNLQYTLFDGFRTRQQVQAAQAQKFSAEIDAKRLELQARSELEQALARLDGATRQLRAAAKAVFAARQNRFATDERFKTGTGNYTDYLLANNQYLTAQINQVNAVFNYRATLFEIQYILGQ